MDVSMSNVLWFGDNSSTDISTGTPVLCHIERGQTHAAKRPCVRPSVRASVRPCVRPCVRPSMRPSVRPYSRSTPPQVEVSYTPPTKISYTTPQYYPKYEI